MWIATEGGVARFDGFAFKILNHKAEPVFASDDISSIAEDSSGALWFGTADGLIQRQGGALRRFDERDGLPSASILSLSAGADGLLVLTSHGLAHLQGSRFVPAVPIGLNILSLEPAPDGGSWLLTSAGVLKYTRGTVTPYTLPSGNPAPAGSILGIQTGSGGATWLRTAVAVTGYTSRMPWQLRVGRDLSGSRTTALFLDHQGTAWIGTNRGLSSFNPASETAPESSQFLRGDSVLSIMEDREGNLWIGTETSGLHVLRTRIFRSEPAASDEAVTAGIVASDETVWYGTRRDGLHSVVHGLARQPVPEAQLTSPVILSLAADKKGEIWAGTPDGLNRLSHGKVRQYTSSNGLPDDFVRSVLVDSQGAVWVGTRQGLVWIDTKKDGESITTYTEADGLGSNSIGPMVEAANLPDSRDVTRSASSVGLWIGTSAGLSHLRGNKLENFSPSSSGPGSAVTALASDESGSLWVALHGQGLHRFKDGVFRSVSSSILPAEIVSVSVDHLGYLWLRGTQGVFRAAIRDLNMLADGHSQSQLPIASYGLQDGLPSDAVAAEGSPAMWQGPRGELWIATRKGIAIAETGRIPVNVVPPPVVLQRFAVDDLDAPLTSGEIRIDPGYKRYTFGYAALSYSQPSKVLYRYMLEGFDRDWVQAGSQRAAFYTSLPPRRYRFRVQAENEDGVWSPSGAEVTFVILPPFYRRWWFYAILVLIGIGIAWSAVQLRLRVAQRRFALILNERGRVAREIHDTLAQDLVSISLQLDVAAHMLKTKEHEQAATQLLATRKLVKDGLEVARQSIWNLRADAAESSLPARFTALAKPHGDQRLLPRLRMGGAYRKLPTDVEDSILRIAQESLVNSYRHADATEVSLHLQYDPDMLRLVIADNGRGFVMSEGKNKQGHYGLRGMEERAALLGAALTIESGPEEGTTVTLLLPLERKKEGRR